MTFLKDRPYYLMFAILALVGFAADQASKYVVFAQLPPGVESWPEDAGAFSLRTDYLEPPAFYKGDDALAFLQTISGERMPRLNRGALFGIGNSQNAEEGWNNFFAVVSLLAAIFIVFWAARLNIAQDRWINIALGLILSGTLGNLYDRVVFGGVRDFLHVDFGFWPFNPWPDFNIADSCLMCGAGVLLVHSFFVRDQEDEPAKPALAGADVPASTQIQSPEPASSTMNGA